MKNLFPFIASLLICTSTVAEVSKIEIESRESVLNGKSFGEAGSYELLKGKIYFTFDPANRYNSRITDIGLAKANSKGLVEAWTEIVILKPVIQQNSKTALIEVSNRGGKFSPRYFNLAQSSSLVVDDKDAFGDALLMAQGLTVVWLGWQFDIAQGQGLKLHAPIAKKPDGSSIFGLVRSDWVVDQTTQVLKLGHRSLEGYPVADANYEGNILTIRSGRDSVRRLVQKELWGFGKIEGSEIISGNDHIYHKNEFEVGHIYELVYLAKDPPLVGLGLAVIRDVISYMKYNAECEFAVKKGIAAGVSQTGRFLRHFVYQGFNTDEQGRKAYDGMMVITAGAGRGSFNHRFAQPSRDAHRYSAFFYPTDLFPFTSTTQDDLLLGYEDGLAAHQWNNSHYPKIFFINTGYEYWGRAAGLIHLSVDATKDVMPLNNERIYHIASGQHFVNAMPDQKLNLSMHPYRGNPLNFFPNYRALLVQLQNWVSNDQPPPESNYPTIEKGTFVSIEALNFKPIGKTEKPNVIHTAYRADYGLGWSTGVVTYQPPRLREQYRPKVSQVNAFGNEMGGIQNCEIAVPLATYTPWHIRKNLSGGNGELTDFRGTFIPLSKAENSNDPRPPIDQLYKNKKDYLNRVDSQINALILQRFVLSRDKKYLQENAERLWEWIVE